MNTSPPTWPRCTGEVRWRWDDQHLVMWCTGCDAFYPIGEKPPDLRAVDVYVRAAGDRFLRSWPTNDHPAAGKPLGEDGPGSLGDGERRPCSPRCRIGNPVGDDLAVRVQAEARPSWGPS